MTGSIKEADWRVFKQIKEMAIERYCERVLAEYREVIDDTDTHPHNRFLLMNRLTENRDKQMALIFDGHARSKMTRQLYGMRLEGLVDDDQLAQLSEELRANTDPDRV